MHNNVNEEKIVNLIEEHFIKKLAKYNFFIDNIKDCDKVVCNTVDCFYKIYTLRKNKEIILEIEIYVFNYLYKNKYFDGKLKFYNANIGEFFEEQFSIYKENIDFDVKDCCSRILNNLQSIKFINKGIFNSIKNIKEINDEDLYNSMLNCIKKNRIFDTTIVDYDINLLIINAIKINNYYQIEISINNEFMYRYIKEDTETLNEIYYNLFTRFCNDFEKNILELNEKSFNMILVDKKKVG